MKSDTSSYPDRGSSDFTKYELSQYNSKIKIMYFKSFKNNINQ